MILKDVLARNLKAWPEGLECLSQMKGNGYIINGKGFDGRAFDAFEIADETLIAGAIVTRSDWQAAVEALKAEQSAEFKWPDGAEFMGTTKEGSPKVFYRNVEGGYEYLYEDEVYWRKRKGTPSMTPLIPRPTERALEWDGVPPAGTVCDIAPDCESCGWDEGEILAVGPIWSAASFAGKCAVLKVEGYKFRPIRTQEQIAAEARAKEMAEMLTIFESACGEGEDWDTLAGLEALYAAGYRKQVAE